MTENDTSPSEGETAEAQSQDILGFFHGTTPADLDLEITPKPRDGFVRFNLQGPPNVTLLLTAERAERVISVLSMAVESLDDSGDGPE